MSRDEPQMEPSSLYGRGRDERTMTPSALLAAGTLLSTLALASATVFSLWQSLEDRDALRQAYRNLEAPHQQALRVRAQVESIAKQLARIAQEGNANAREVVEALRRQGITINPN